MGTTAAAAIIIAGPTFPLLAAAVGDTDQDGLTNHAEATFHGTDPLISDTDQDGHTDGAEVAAGSDPLDFRIIPLPTIGSATVAGIADAIGHGAAGTVSDACDSVSPGCAALPNRVGYDAARARATADLDGDGVQAVWDLDDTTAAVRWTHLDDLDGDGRVNALDPDVDGDGIPNELDADDDNDGLSDLDETSSHGSNPHSRDSDGDGLSDYAEVTSGTDPLSPDSDGDGTPDGQDAKPLSASVVATIGSAADGDIAPFGGRDGVLSVGDVVVAVRFAADPALASSADIDHGDVAPLGNPDGELTLADALLILRAVRGEDVDGDGLDTNIELSAGASPFLSDTDGDGLTDADEVQPPGGLPPTNPASRDTDGDGLTDHQKRHSGSVTDSTVADSDGDGVDDGDDAQPGERIVFYHRDHLGSVAVVASMRGSVVTRATHKPFGEVMVETGVSAPFGFTGQRVEPLVDLVDLRARWYDPSLGRFTSADPIADPYAPQSLNRYAYALNEPVSTVDPTGLFAIHAAIGPSVPSLGFSPDFFSSINPDPHSLGQFGTFSSSSVLAQPVRLERLSQSIGNLFIRSFAPFDSFGGGVEGDNRGFTTDLGVRSRVSARIPINLDTLELLGEPSAQSSRSSCLSDFCRALVSTATGRPIREQTVATGRPTISVSRLNGGGLAIDVAGANPLLPSADIDLRLTLQRTKAGLSLGLTGDAFPNAEVFFVDQSGSARMLLEFTTSGGAVLGPYWYLPGNSQRDMGGAFIEGF